MRFTRRPKIEGFHWTDRKLALYLRKPERLTKKLQKDYPLFADQIDVTVLSAEDERLRRDRLNRESEQCMRDLEAKFWREARTQYFACPPETRQAIRQYWNGWTGPATALNFIYVVEKFNGVAEQRSLAIRERDRALRERIAREIDTTGDLTF